MSALPRAVKKVVDQANAIADQYYKDLEAANVAPPAAPEAPAPDAPPAPPAPPETPAPPAPEETAEARYRSLQGKYNAEVPRLQRQLNELQGRFSETTSQLTATQNLLASLNAQRAPAPAAPDAPAPTTRLLSAEEIKEFGPDLVDMIRRAAREEFSSLLPTAVQPVVERVAKVEKVASTNAVKTEETEREAVIRLLAEKVPDYLKLNGDPDFIAWLDQVDPYSGQKRGNLLRHAFDHHDGQRVVSFFLGYQTEHATVAPTPPAAAQEPAAPAPAPAAPQRKLESLVAPGTPKTGPVSTQDGSGKRIWTRDQISQFYADVNAGKYRGAKADQRKELENDIFAAQREGRIR